MESEIREEHHSETINILKALIVVGELICLFGQWLVFVISGEVVRMIPETAPALWPYRIAGVTGILCFEIALIAVWPLLTLVKQRDVFSGKAVRWVNLIIGCACVEGLIVFAVLVFSNLGLSYADPDGDGSVAAAVGAPLFEIALVCVLLLIAAFVLLMRVMRSLLTQAIVQRRELEAVI